MQIAFISTYVRFIIHLCRLQDLINATVSRSCALMNGNTFTYVPNVAIPAGNLYKDLLDAAVPALGKDVYDLTGVQPNPQVRSFATLHGAGNNLGSQHCTRSCNQYCTEFEFQGKLKRG